LGYAVLPVDLRHRHPSLHLLDGIPDLLLREENFSYRLGSGNGANVRSAGTMRRVRSKLWAIAADANIGRNKVNWYLDSGSTTQSTMLDLAYEEA